MADTQYYYGKGRRKTATAKVRLYVGGTGEFTVNGKTLAEYISVDAMQASIYGPLETVGLNGKFNISVVVRGGGVRGQADAIKHGIARALEVYDPLFRASLKKEGFLTRDARKKERKKPGLKKARRASQFSKR
jgi:small subunit ribosomal protein S9